MAAVTIEAHGPVAVLRLTNGVTNAIGSAVLRDIELLLPEVREAFRGLVLAGNPKFFSIGLDLPELLALDRDGMADFWRRFEDLVLALYTIRYPRPAPRRARQRRPGPSWPSLRFPLRRHGQEADQA